MWEHAAMQLYLHHPDALLDHVILRHEPALGVPVRIVHAILIV
jgi:hypothetical protein